MGSDARLLVRVEVPQTEARLVAAGFSIEYRLGAWVSIGDREEDEAVRLSSELGVTTVWWMIHTVANQIWLKCYLAGVLLRELRYSGEEGWAQNTGRKLSFESPALKKWLRKRHLLASPDGYEVLDCFLGHAPPEPVKGVKEPGSNADLYLPAAIAAEVQALAKQRGVTFGAILAAAWELGKHAVLAAREAEDPSSTVELAPAGHVELAHAPSSIAALVHDENATVRCAIVLPEPALAELRRTQGAFGYAMKWLLRDAYLRARDRLV